MHRVRSVPELPQVVPLQNWKLLQNFLGSALRLVVCVHHTAATHHPQRLLLLFHSELDAFLSRSKLLAYFHSLERKIPERADVRRHTTIGMSRRLQMRVKNISYYATIKILLGEDSYFRFHASVFHFVCSRYQCGLQTKQLPLNFCSLRAEAYSSDSVVVSEPSEKKLAAFEHTARSVGSNSAREYARLTLLRLETLSSLLFVAVIAFVPQKVWDVQAPSASF
mmetsp:Transcript_10199/g.18370  ORF Transcript_10199/g.18370 Transcript_10199/m.18370 type:complete len:223 (+) Transcript_10199:2270-2938(+)